MGTPLMSVFTSPLPFFHHPRTNSFYFTRILFLLILCTIFANLGVWHLNQGALKTLTELKNETHQTKTITLDALIQHQGDTDLSNTYFKASGTFDNLHAIKVPVKNNKRSGFELYVPFYIFGSEKLILVDKGFFTSLPSPFDAPPNFGQQEIHGILRKTFSNVIQGHMLTQATHQNYFDYVLIENGKNTISNMTFIKKEMTYAVVWFMFSGFFLMLCFLGKKSRKK